MNNSAMFSRLLVLFFVGCRLSILEANFVVEEGENVSTTQQINGGETGIVESGGSIITTLNNEQGVFSTGAGNLVRNHGFISTSGMTTD